ncbi:glycosyltransferase [Burkholderia multivorans]|uniref:Glycosyl transferase n=1 Tax=Burkholderia multivorans (strain ATCC 17616 / 249) TaxID=395019 RepID=A0A0H3KC95_BURM1|nr:glycosyltransferase [Burkholderia multivorans]ABX16287.1 glycosyl transferase family 2 [Burkholderia multivorans ATCC 17616]PRF51025.1 glycosyl transferase [Burkholderia multivorans]BAG42598.1 putative glycosyl transferase [Burkholderia multivorans ATCC 17616]
MNKFDSPLKKTNPIHEIGYNILGPIVQRWMLGINQYINYLSTSQTKILFCARAGVRISKLYETFLENSNFHDSSQRDILWVSRISVAKGIYHRKPELTTKIISNEYAHEPIKNLIKGVLRHQQSRLSHLNLELSEYAAHGFNFPGWIQGPTPAAASMRDYFQKCGVAFDDYIRESLGDCTQAVLIDSGWQGTMQSMLNEAYPEIKWKGLYFGRILTSDFNSKIVDDIIGIIFQSEKYESQDPATAFIRHRHLIEALVEPNGPSIEEIPSGEFLGTANSLIDKNVNEIYEDHDALFECAMDYLANEGKNASITKIISNYELAIQKAARLILHPSRDDAMALLGKERSADFGKDITVPVLRLPGHSDFATADLRIQHALWQEGQIALEYDGAMAYELQSQISGQRTIAAYFDPKSEDQKTSGVRAHLNRPSVAIITRTKNRPLLLKRAAHSVANQSYTNYTWVIVNDGGDLSPVLSVIEESLIDRRKIVLVHNESSLGMEAASNAGISNSTSDYIVIHDDDDSWEPAFLEKTVSFLSSPSGNRYGGVITHSTYISEEIKNNTVVEHHRQPYMNWVRNVQIAEMAAGNIFPPIAFLYKRSFWEEIGGYNEKLPVLGDWYFNLAFLLKGDIAVLTEPLANYHHRDRGTQTAYTNSVVGGISKHEEFAAIARNEFVRQYGKNDFGALTAIFGYYIADIRNRINGIQGETRSITNNTQSPTNPISPNQSHDDSDRKWVISNINKTRRAKSFFKKNDHPHISQDASWQEINALLQKRKIVIPPPQDFDEDTYLKKNSDVANAVQHGRFSSGYQHYILHGKREGRGREYRTQ